MTEQRRLFTPIKLGRAELSQRVALAPLTRYRAPDHVPVERHTTYYSQRAAGGLLVTEGTYIALEAGGEYHIPGIWSKVQIEGWKHVTKAVHNKEGVIYLQLWAIGRSNPGQADVSRTVSASNLPLEDGVIPEPMSKKDIQRYIGLYSQAAHNAIAAGFDGVEIHSANGYLLQQFIEEVSNVRTDEYGGVLENRTRFCKEVMAAVVEAVGEERVGIRFSPWSTFQGMGQSGDAETTYLHLCRHIKNNYPKLSYVHFVEDSEAWRGQKTIHPRSNDPFRAVFRQSNGQGDLGLAFPEPDDNNPTVFISCGDFKTQSSIKLSQLKGDLIAIGRSYISNPDVPDRIRNDWEWTPHNRETFYTPLSDIGYIDYAVHGKRGHGEEAAEKKAQKQKANM